MFTPVQDSNYFYLFSLVPSFPIHINIRLYASGVEFYISFLLNFKLNKWSKVIPSWQKNKCLINFLNVVGVLRH